MAKSLVYTSRSINKKNLSSSFMKRSIASQPAAIGHERCTSVGHRIRLLWKWSHLSRKARHLNSSEMPHNAVPKRATFRNWARDFVTCVGLGPPTWPGCGIQTVGPVFFLERRLPNSAFTLSPDHEFVWREPESFQRTGAIQSYRTSCPKATGTELCQSRW